MACLETHAVLLGHRIERARLNRGWSRSDLARRASVDPSYVTRIEEAHYKRPSVEKVSAIAGALGLPMAELVDPPTEPTADQEHQAELVARILDVLGPERAHHLSDVLREIGGWPERDQDAVIQVIRAAVFSGAWGNKAPTVE